MHLDGDGRSTPLAVVAGSGSARAPAWRFVPTSRLGWREPGRLQVEVAGRSVVVEGIDHDTVRALRQGEPLPATAGDQFRRSRHHVARDLYDAGLLIDDDDDPAVDTPAALLAPERAALSARRGDRASAVLVDRAQRRVAVHGGGRLPALIGALLGAAGVGHVHVAETGEARLSDVIPGGLLASDEGRRRAGAASAAIHRVAPSTDTASFTPWPADLIILTTGVPVPRNLAAGLANGGHPHLLTGVRGGEVVIGPLVVAGLTSCLRCADLYRRDRDPAWPALQSQLELEDRAAAPTEVVVASLAASVTALQALQYLDGEAPASMNGTLELAMPDWRLRRRTWPVHPDCPCTGARTADRLRRPSRRPGRPG